MAYVSVPKDLTKIKNKVMLNLTRTDHLSDDCGGCGAAVLFFDQKLYWDQQCGNGHGSSDASGISVCHVRERRNAAGKGAHEYDLREIQSACDSQI